MSEELPPVPALGHPCEHCGSHIPRSTAREGGRPRLYCGRSCRQRAYEARRQLAAIAAAVAAAVAEQSVSSRDATDGREESSRDGTGDPSVSSRDATDGREESSRDDPAPMAFTAFGTPMPPWATDTERGR